MGGKFTVWGRRECVDVKRRCKRSPIRSLDTLVERKKITNDCSLLLCQWGRKWQGRTAWQFGSLNRLGGPKIRVLQSLRRLTNSLVWNHNYFSVSIGGELCQCGIRARRFEDSLRNTLYWRKHVLLRYACCMLHAGFMVCSFFGSWCFKESKVTLRTTVSPPVCLGVKPRIWGSWPDLYYCQTVAGLLM
jgi:hypothetical protein